MKSILYIYDKDSLLKLKEKLSHYNFVSIAYFFNIFNTIEEINDIDNESINDIVIDISNIIRDGNHNLIFTERYLSVLAENIKNVHFCLQSEHLTDFIQSFPYFFEEENINFDFHKEQEDTSEIKIELCNPLDLYVYNNSLFIKKLVENDNIVPLTNLIDECDGITFKYNINRISTILLEMPIEYIDISSVIKMLNLRKELTFLFEIIIQQLSRIKKIKFTLEKKLLEDINELFPIVFANIIELDNSDCPTEIIDGDPQSFDLELINSKIDNINKALRGHTAFKIDFKHCLIKYYFLNNIGEQNILSILLCGDSGLGKTEFAKILSNILFPEMDLIKINFGNYSSEGVLNSLIGAPLGYIGSEEGGELINKISTSKSKVILIDEFERATPSVYNFFYELLEDGIFTDRHGKAHNLNEYIIVFTSNMTQTQYKEHIPNSLKSRFDMVYYFTDLPTEEKDMYIRATADKLIKKLNDKFCMELFITDIDLRLSELVKFKNLRDIKRKIQDIVFSEFFKYYKKE